MRKLFILIAAFAASVAQAQDAAPVARANWAVARAGGQVYTFYGLGAGKTFADIERDVAVCGARCVDCRTPGIPGALWLVSGV